ncbi:dTDP-4-dehydrorhamnose 3,5-epimerase [Seonamhaeicola marinus]|uniref:dTDP-4-dehydrorhamnose 3,5-epimerase n=1 Tax=Seonamhaeicola marinus TaxID=1912246 RepID=A0A5D0HUJ1_9FLAO|nr:dTDP-4-dehydrorhamnose 3,5-epimerase [Seonamhaeicola marinus]TYA74139.1 dTDP-4-dehydrorhamnose 3,5-epimerase [Seonamhaeicola marinus]
MKVEETNLEGCFVITPSVFEDSRGFFYESFNHKKFNEFTGADVHFVQDNVSKSTKGVLRGLHFQIDEHAQAKLVKVLSGKVLDVAVDLRPNSKTFGKHFSIILDAYKHQHLFIPRGFAHGFHVLEDNTIFSYKCDNYYCKPAERGVFYNDEQLKIDWKIQENIILSSKDKELPTLKKFLLEI